MTLRIVGGKPVGLDWGVCNDGNENPSIWSGKSKKAPKPKPVSEKPTKQKAIADRAQALRLAVEIEAEILVMYRDELQPATRIAKHFNISHQTVYKVLQRNNVPVRSKSEAKKLLFAERKES